MPIPENVKVMWSAYVESIGGITEDRFYEAFSFGDSASMADELGQLVLAGTKRATAGSSWSYEESEKGFPMPGHLSVVTDASGKPLCIIETTSVDIVKFNEVTAEFAATEGEGDGSLSFWRDAHRAFFTRECQRSGKVFSEDMLVACERFSVVYPRSASSAV